MKFFLMFVSTTSSAEVWSLFSTVSLGMRASATTVFPLPYIMLMAAGFLSLHMLPDTDTMTASVASSITLHAASEAMVAMFMPMASPVSKLNLR